MVTYIYLGGLHQKLLEKPSRQKSPRSELYIIGEGIYLMLQSAYIVFFFIYMIN